MTVTQQRVRELLDYEPLVGVFTWRVDRSSARIGDLAGIADRQGYIRVKLDGRRYSAHRLAWLYVYGVLPDNEIDHVNLVKFDNRIDNLRLATRKQNVANRPVRRNNTSGFKGVCFNKRKQKWQAAFKTAGKRKHLGYFNSPEAAHEAYSTKAQAVHGEYARAA